MTGWMQAKKGIPCITVHIASLITHSPQSCSLRLAPLFSPLMATSRSYVLLQKGEDPFHTRFEDLDGLTAFTVYAFSATVPLKI